MRIRIRELRSFTKICAMRSGVSDDSSGDVFVDYAPHSNRPELLSFAGLDRVAVTSGTLKRRDLSTSMDG